MSRNGMFVGLIALGLGIALVFQIRKGELWYRSVGRSRRRLRRADQPRLFWALATLYAAAILLTAWLAFTT